MDGFDDLVKRACEHVGVGRLNSARHLLRELAAEAAQTPEEQGPELGLRLYAWLRDTAKAFEELGVSLDGVLAIAAKSFVQDASVAARIDRFNTALELIFEQSDVRLPPAVAFVRRAKTWIEANFQRRIDVADVIEALGCKERYFRAMFQKASDLPASTHIEVCRVDRAKELLEPPCPFGMEVIAATCGFGAERTFRRAFRKHTGMSPSEYRQSKRRRT